jgi:5-methylcytosine-specific restriction endonuclease McrA
MMSTLVLNRAWQADRVVSWQEAMRLIFSGRAEVVENHNDRFVKTVTRVFHTPAVIRMLVGQIIKNDRIKLSRRRVWIRDNGKCQYCNQAVSMTSMTYDHVLPRSRGGKTTWDNIVLACSSCNLGKGDKTPNEAGMALVKRPAAPRKIHLLRSASQDCAIWQRYCGMS